MNRLRYTQIASLFVILAVTSLNPGAEPAPKGLWEPVTATTAQKLSLRPFDPPQWNRTSAARYFKLDRNLLTDILARTPVEGAARSDGFRRPVEKSEITLPLPDGSLGRFNIEATRLMSPELAARFPGIRTFRGQRVDDPSTTLRMEVTPKGLSAQILSFEKGTVLVDPVAGDDDLHSTLRKYDLRRQKPFQCLVKTAEKARRPIEEIRPARSGESRRTYRLAIACTREYAAIQSRGAQKGDIVARTMEAIVRTTNRVDGIYERDLSIRLQLVANNHLLVFSSLTPDKTYPFTTNNDANVLINESQRVIDKIIGETNYDIGHTFSTGAGGLAGLGVVCRNGQKAQGVTGSASPMGDGFDVDYVAHEMGHQFGGNHTFNGNHNSCGGGNRNESTAYEPGSGSTIQGYAGICGPDDLQPHSHDYFHSASLDEIIAYTTTGPGRAVPTDVSGNTPPSVRGQGKFTIPHGTPFVLTATGADADGDALAYCWEQRDLGPDAALIAADDGRIPLFRSLPPSASPMRAFPKMTTLLSNSASVDEKLPERDRTMRFRVTVRDNRGGTNGDDVIVNVTQSAGPFRVTFPTKDTHAGLTTVKWNVAETDVAPINVSSVDILLSTDGGRTFPSTLANNVENDGQHVVTLPSINTSTARIMVRSVGNIFFAVSTTDFTIGTNQSSVLVVPVPGLPANPDSASPELKRLLAKTKMDRVIQIGKEDSPANIQEKMVSARGVSAMILVDRAKVGDVLKNLQVLDAKWVGEALAKPVVVTTTSKALDVRVLSLAGRPSVSRPSSENTKSPPTDEDRKATIKKLEELERQINELRKQLDPSRSERNEKRPVGRLADRHVIYIHGICKHSKGYSDEWWKSMKEYVAEIPEENRHEVLWSDLVNTAQARQTRGKAARRADMELIRDGVLSTLKDRAVRQRVDSAGDEGGLPAVGARGVLEDIPFVACIDDFTIYLLDNDVRKEIQNRFLVELQPLLEKGATVEVISHSWGTVVAYEALRSLDADSPRAGGVHNLFTVGSALSIYEVQRRLETPYRDGKRPRVVSRWYNLNARFDVVGGALRGVPFEVDEDVLGLKPVGCTPFIPNPSCSHRSYFDKDNTRVNRDIFARRIRE